MHRDRKSIAHAKIQRSCDPQEFQLQCLIVPEVGGKTHCQCHFKRAWARGIRQESSWKRFHLLVHARHSVGKARCDLMQFQSCPPKFDTVEVQLVDWFVWRPTARKQAKEERKSVPKIGIDPFGKRADARRWTNYCTGLEVTHWSPFGSLFDTHLSSI